MKVLFLMITLMSFQVAQAQTRPNRPSRPVEEPTVTSVSCRCEGNPSVCIVGIPNQTLVRIVTLSNGRMTRDEIGDYSCQSYDCDQDAANLPECNN